MTQGKVFQYILDMDNGTFLTNSSTSPVDYIFPEVSRNTYTTYKTYYILNNTYYTNLLHYYINLLHYKYIDVIHHTNTKLTQRKLIAVEPWRPRYPRWLTLTFLTSLLYVSAGDLLGKPVCLEPAAGPLHPGQHHSQR